MIIIITLLYNYYYHYYIQGSLLSSSLITNYYCYENQHNIIDDRNITYAFHNGEFFKERIRPYVKNE